MKKPTLMRAILCLASIYLSSSLSAQTADPSQFFPHALGNKWRSFNNISYSTFDSEITRDSVAFDGSVHLFYGQASVPRYKVDTLDHVYQFLNTIDTLNHTTVGPAILWYKLEAAQGDSFYTWNNTYQVRVTVGNSVVFGHPVNTKTYTWYGNPSGSWVASQTLAHGFGLIRSNADIGPVDFDITGCVIDGVQFGTLVGIGSNNEEPARTFSLHQNYPNPFNPTTIIGFDLIHAGMVKLTVYDMLGREVAVLLDGFMEAGSHKIKFDAGNLPSAVYLYKLQSSSFTQIKRLVLTK